MLVVVVADPLAKSAVSVIQEDREIDERAERQRAASEMQKFVRHARHAALRRGNTGAAPTATSSLSASMVPMRGSATPGLGGASAAGLDQSGLMGGGEAISWERSDKVEHLVNSQAICCGL